MELANKRAMDMVEQAVINVMFARAELAEARQMRNMDAIDRAIEHIDWALGDLKNMTPRYDMPEIDERAGAG